MDGQYATYVYAPPLLAALAAFVGALFVFEAATRRIRVPFGRAALLPALLLAGAAVWLWLVADVGPALPAWDAHLQQALARPGWLQQATRLLSSALSFPFALFALFCLFVWAVIKRRWPEAYFALAAGPGLAAVLVALKVVYPRWPPGSPPFQPFFLGPTAFPNDAAALVPAALFLWGLLRRRLVPASRVPWFALFVVSILACAAPVLAGYAWPSDVLAGVAVAAAWLAVCVMGLLLHDGWIAHPESLGHRAVARLDAFAQRVAARPTRWLVGIIAFGAGLRIVSYWTMPLAVDAYSYAAMAHSLLQRGAFTMVWGDVDTFHTLAVPSHHYPPLYPVYLAGFYRVLGFSQATTHVAAIASSLAAMLVTFLCSRDLYGTRKALVVTAVVAVSPILVQNAGQGYSENLVLLLFVATLWAILKSLDRPWYIVAAGILAGLGYLTKSTMGPFFIIAGLGGLAWRLYWKGWRVLRDPPYITAIAGFGILVAAWAWRNIRLFGSWDTSFHITDAYRAALAHPGAWASHALVTVVFYATVGYLLYLALLPWLPRLARIPKLESEHDSGLWLALGLPLALTAAIDACLWLIEREFFVNNVRYIAFVTVPAAWLLVRHLPVERREVRVGAVLTFAILIAGSVFLVKPQVSTSQLIADDLAARMGPDDSVAFVDNNNHYAYRFYFQFTQDGTRERHVEIACDRHPLCPPDVQRVGQLNTTWVLIQEYAASQLPSYYERVVGGPATSDASHPEYLTLWRHK